MQPSCVDNRGALAGGYVVLLFGLENCPPAYAGCRPPGSTGVHRIFARPRDWGCLRRVGMSILDVNLTGRVACVQASGPRSGSSCNACACRL